MSRAVDRIPDEWRFVVVGQDGMLARAWRGLLTAHALPFACVGRPAFDLAVPESFAERDAAGVTHVINCAAWTDVDGAEAAEADAHAVNGAGAAALARWADDHGATVVHYSSDYVFPGNAAEPYAIDADVDPIGAYGRSKAAGESGVADATRNHLIIRTSWLYAPWGTNFPRTIARLAAERDELSVVNDQVGRPTSAEHLARSTLALLLRGVTGTWHVTDAGAATWYDLAREIVAWTRAECTVHPCTTDEFPRPAPRPRYSVLDITRTEDLLGPMPTWQTNLADVLRRAPLHD